MADGNYPIDINLYADICKSVELAAEMHRVKGNDVRLADCMSIIDRLDAIPESSTVASDEPVDFHGEHCGHCARLCTHPIEEFSDYRSDHLCFIRPDHKACPDLVLRRSSDG